MAGVRTLSMPSARLKNVPGASESVPSGPPGLGRSVTWIWPSIVLFPTAVLTTRLWSSTGLSNDQAVHLGLPAVYTGCARRFNGAGAL